MKAWIDYRGLTREEFANPTSLQWRRPPAIHLLHSTEGNGYPSAKTYRDGRSAPHFTVDMRRRTARQHYPLTEGAWALQAPAGVATNTGGAVQYELIGTCSGMRGVYDVTQATDEELAYLAGLLLAVSRETGIPIACSVPFISYPASIRGVRMSAAAWGSYRGIAGHQHVPGNSHGDPGDFPVERLVAIATGTSSTTKPAPPAEPERKDDDMLADIDGLYRHYLGRDPHTDPGTRAEADAWLVQAIIDGRDLQWIQQGIAQSDEAKRRAIALGYASLDREPSAADVASWLAAANADAIRQGIHNSDEAKARRATQA